jgi:hypothetical protein
MIPLALRLFGIAAPSWLTKPIGYLLDALLIIGLLGGVYFAIYHKGENAGSAKVEARTEKAHTAAVADARKDERAAQATTTRIADRTVKIDAATTAYANNEIGKIHAILAATPDGPVAAPVDTPSVSASLDAIIDRANRAADAADAGPEVDPG